MEHWTKEEIKYLKKHYSFKLDKVLSKELGRSIKAIGYMAQKLNLRKNKAFYSTSRRHLNFEIKRSKLILLYKKQKKSTRAIAKELNVGKTTIEYYLKKYNIKRRTHSTANIIRFSRENVWTKGLNKNTDLRIAKIANKIRKAFEKKRMERLKKIEQKHDMPMKKLLTIFYWKEKLTQEKIAKKLGIPRLMVIQLMKEYHIQKRPNFEYIASLKEKSHSQYGKTWELVRGKKKALFHKQKMSIVARKSIIQRLQNNEMPFSNTLIEKLLAKEMSCRGIPFMIQFPIINKIVCDFAIPEFKIIIECDGDYWHANPKIYDYNSLDMRQKDKLKRDKNKGRILKKEGWLLLRFFESDIKSSVVKCVDQIEKAIKQRKKEKL